MDIYLTSDYEIYFGKPHGTIENCLIKPTQLLIEMCKEHNIGTTQFIDVGFLIALKREEKKYPQLKKERLLIEEQIKLLITNKHSCQLHIHPHWEDAHFYGKSWEISTKRYKLSDFTKNEAENIILNYHKYLSDLTQKKVNSFRAGGWCIQPFDTFSATFKKLGIQTDSSVFIGGKNTTSPYNYDFTGAKNASHWQFSSDPAVADPNGYFTELPITEANYSPLFFWKLYGWGRLIPKNHKPIGDGHPIASGKNMKWKYLTQKQQLFASMDGYFTIALQRIVQQQTFKKRDEMVVIGHPKAYTFFSLKKLNSFIDRNKKIHSFKTMGEQ